MKKIIIVFVTLILMLIFTNNILAINENFNKDVFNDKNIMKVPQKLEDEKKPVHAMGIYHFIYQNISDEDKKNQVLRNIKRLRNKTDNKYGFGLNANEGVGIEIRPLTENRKADLGLKGYNVYKLFVTNMNDTPIELNVHMTKYTAIPISGTQINALSSIELINENISSSKAYDLQRKTPANQKIYANSEIELLLIYERKFNPRKIIVDGILMQDNTKAIRVDGLFLGLEKEK